MTEITLRRELCLVLDYYAHKGEGVGVICRHNSLNPDITTQTEPKMRRLLGEDILYSTLLSYMVYATVLTILIFSRFGTVESLVLVSH